MPNIQPGLIQTVTDFDTLSYVSRQVQKYPI